MSAKISIPGGNGRMGKTLIKEIIANENLELANSFLEDLDNNDDVQNIYTNANLENLKLWRL